MKVSLSEFLEAQLLAFLLCEKRAGGEQTVIQQTAITAGAMG